jgi:hypothetical protein
MFGYIAYVDVKAFIYHIIFINLPLAVLLQEVTSHQDVRIW